MAVAISNQTPSPNGVNGSGTTVTYTGAAIGTASNDRMVVVAVSSEDGTAGAATKVTIGGQSAVFLTGTNFVNQYVSLWWASISSGTTADIVVTFTSTAPVAAANHISVHAVTGAEPSPSAVGTHTSTDMDVNAPLTLAVTVPASGGVLALANGALNTTTSKAWGGNVTEREEIGTGNYCHTTATGTTSGATTITCTGSSNNEDGSLAVVVFAPASGKPQNYQSSWPNPTASTPALALTRALINPGLGLTSTPPADTTNLPSGTEWGPPPPALKPNTLSWTNALSLPLNVVVPAPFAQFDWPNPRGHRPRDLTWLTPSHDLTSPFFQSDWPNPRGHRPRDFTWIHNPPRDFRDPLRQTDWPNPRGLAPNNLGFADNPFRDDRDPLKQTDWPNPKGFATKDGTWINPGITAGPQAAPFFQTDWPNPKGLQPRSGYTFSQQIPNDTNTYLPSSALDWYTPPAVGQTLSYTLRPSIALTTTVVQSPFAQYDWPNPRGHRARDLTWINGLPPIAYVFRQALVRRLNPQSWHTAINSQPRANLTPLQTYTNPFSQTDWPNPRAHRPLTLSYTLSVNLPIATYVNVKPFNQASWPNPSGPVTPTSLRDFIEQSQIALYTTPPEVVTPPVEVRNDPAGIRSGVWKPRKYANYRTYRFRTEEEIRALTGNEIRQAARDLRADVRKDPLADEVEKEVYALRRMVDVLSDIDRLEKSVAELTRAIEFAAEQRAKALRDAEDDEITFLLLS